MRLIDPDSTKSLEKRVTEAFLRKLYYKVDDEQIFIDKEVFIQLILKDIIAIAKGQYDIDKALKFALKEHPDYKDAPATKRNELVEAAEQYAIEVDAYFHYLDSIKENSDDDSIYDEVFFILNSDDDLVSKRLHEVMMQAIERKVPEMDDPEFDRDSLIDSFANQVRFIASNETIDEAVEEAYYEYTSYIEEGLFTRPYLKKEFERFAPLAQDEIQAYKMALSLRDQNAEIGMILATVKQLLQLS
jgi:hypothetical protein